MTALPAIVPATAIARYDAACRSLAEALAAADAVDEVLDVGAMADALRLRARQAQNKDLEIQAAELRIRAERRIGEMIAAQRAGVGLATVGMGAEAGAGGRFAAATLPTLEAVGIGKALADRARKSAALSVDRFEQLLAARRADIEDGRRRVAVDLFRSATTAEKAERRARLEVDLAAKQRALPESCYGVILADPEWRFKPRSDETGMDRAAANHYPTSETADIAARDVRRIAADDCALFLWATVPMLPDALEVMRAWGFDYKSHTIWLKSKDDIARDEMLRPQIGTGYWFRVAHELLLVGTRGAIPAPAPGTQWPSVFTAPRGAHSAKPERSYELIEQYYPNLPKIELGRRGPPRPGWGAWGNQAELDGGSRVVYDNECSRILARIDSILHGLEGRPECAAEAVEAHDLLHDLSTRLVDAELLAQGLRS